MKTPTDLAVPEYPDDPKRQAAYTRYVVKGESAVEVLTENPTSLATFRKWREEGNWDEKRASILLTERRAAAHEVGIVAAKAASPIFQRYATLQDKLLTSIEDRIDEYDGNGEASSLDLLRLTQAMTACHNVGKHMLGVSGIESAGEENKGGAVTVQVAVLNAVQEQLDGAVQV